MGLLLIKFILTVKLRLRLEKFNALIMSLVSIYFKIFKYRMSILLTLVYNAVFSSASTTSPSDKLNLRDESVFNRISRNGVTVSTHMNHKIRETSKWVIKLERQ